MRVFIFLIAAVLTGCAGLSSSEREPAPAVSSDAVSPLLREACDFSDVVLGSPAHEREMRRCEDYIYDHRSQQNAYAHQDFARALHTGDCETVAQLEADGFSPGGGAVYEAGVLRCGLCTAKDPKAAADILETALRNWPENPLAMAHLGDMLWHGEGVRQDRTRARQLFKQAVNLSLPDYVARFHAAKKQDRSSVRDEWLTISETGYFWFFSRQQLAANFADPILGPWIFPEPLYQERMRMEATLYGAGDAIVAKAKALLSDGSKLEEEAAAGLLLEASYADVHPASYALAQFLSSRDKASIPDALSALTAAPRCEALDFLTRAARDGYYPALRELVPVAEQSMRAALPAGVLERVMTDASVTQHGLREAATGMAERDRDLIYDIHDFTAMFLAHGFPVPQALGVVAERILLEVSDPDLYSPATPSVYGARLFQSGC
ncbi:MAG: hypothetical protein AAF607_08730 [Pseudomonadota bacterium]